MKKAAALSMAAVMAAAMAGCGSSSTETETAETTEAAAEDAADAEETAAEEDTAGEAEEADGEEKTYRIGVLQYVQHDALDKCNEGFIEALDASGISYEVDQQNAAGDTPTCTTIAQKFVNDGDDLIFAIATPAAQACAAETEEIPIVLTGVTDPAGSGLVDTNEAPGGQRDRFLRPHPRGRADRPAAADSPGGQDRGHSLLLRRVQLRDPGAAGP